MDILFQIRVKHQILNKNEYFNGYQKNTHQNIQKTRSDRSDRSGIGFWSEFFENKYDYGYSSIHFIQNLMLNSNLKSDIQKNIKTKRFKTKKGQTEFDRVPKLVNTISKFNFGALKTFFAKKKIRF
jgi:hypothetical protein